jgi:hypothetical protein
MRERADRPRIRDIALVETADGDIAVHRADCPQVRLAADAGWMVCTMFGVQKRSALRGLPVHACMWGQGENDD